MTLLVIALVLITVVVWLWPQKEKEMFFDANARHFPEVVGMKVVDARKYLEAMGLRVRIVLTKPPVRDNASIYLIADDQSTIVRQL